MATPAKVANAPVKIAKCTCNYPAQDELHGKENRVHNPCAVGGGTEIMYRCSVCGKVRS